MRAGTWTSWMILWSVCPSSPATTPCGHWPPCPTPATSITAPVLSPGMKKKKKEEFSAAWWNHGHCGLFILCCTELCHTNWSLGKSGFSLSLLCRCSLYHCFPECTQNCTIIVICMFSSPVLQIITESTRNRHECVFFSLSLSLIVSTPVFQYWVWPRLWLLCHCWCDQEDQGVWVRHCDPGCGGHPLSCQRNDLQFQNQVEKITRAHRSRDVETGLWLQPWVDEPLKRRWLFNSVWVSVLWWIKKKKKGHHQWCSNTMTHHINS